MSSYTYSPLVGQAETEFGFNQSYKVQGDPDLDKLDFLKLLTTQLSNQDPMNPMEDKEFTAQMAEFTSLEQLMNISEGIDNLAATNSRQDMFSAVSFIGKQIRAEGDTVTKSGENVSTLYFDLESPIADGVINVFDANGNVVRTELLGTRDAGEYEYVWDGLDYNGEECDDGKYYIYMAAETAEGIPVLVTTDVAGEVAGVENSDGYLILRLADGRMVNFMNIKEVVNPVAEVEDDAEAETEAEAEQEET